MSSRRPLLNPDRLRCRLCPRAVLSSIPIDRTAARRPVRSTLRLCPRRPHLLPLRRPLLSHSTRRPLPIDRTPPPRSSKLRRARKSGHQRQEKRMKPLHERLRQPHVGQKRKRACSECGNSTHNRRACPRPKIKVVDGSSSLLREMSRCSEG